MMKKQEIKLDIGYDQATHEIVLTVSAADEQGTFGSQDVRMPLAEFFQQARIPQDHIINASSGVEE